ncbi:MAG: hypothetical protein PUJ35_05280 [Ruminococcus bromii]|nr:hypothetical protein [Ruminococcus bromii]MDD7646642.1 hypothetical protein [Ruminococcus bromii]
MTALLFLIKAAIWIWRFDTVYKQSMNIVKGVGLGIAAGAAVAAVSSKMMSGKKSAKARTKEMRRSTAKAVHTVGQLIDGVESMLK